MTPQDVITAKDKKIPDKLYWSTVDSIDEAQYKFNMNKIALLFPTAATYLCKIPVNFWICYAINDELLKKNPEGGGGSYGWRASNLGEGSMSRNKKWRYLHVLHFFQRFVRHFVSMTDYIKEKVVEWQHEVLTPCAKRQLAEAEKEALFRDVTLTGSSTKFSVESTTGSGREYMVDFETRQCSCGQ